MAYSTTAATLLAFLVAATPLAAVTLECAAASGPAGGVAVLEVRFSADPGEIVGGIQNDLTFDSEILSATLGDSGTPNCALDSGIGPGSEADKRLARAFVDGDLGRARAIVFSQQNQSPIPPGPLYTCRFSIAADAPLREHNVELLDLIVSDTVGDLLPAVARPCSITVTDPLTPTPTPTPDGFCKDDQDCADNQVCVDNHCVTPTPPGFCNDDADCGPGEVCADDRCATPTPSVTPDGFCREDQDCNGGVCVDGRCATPTPDGFCEDEADCAAGELCIDNRCTPPTPTPEGFCEGDDDCTSGETCVDNRCATPTPGSGGGGGCGCSVEPDPPAQIALNLLLAALPIVWVWRRRRRNSLRS